MLCIGTKAKRSLLVCIFYSSQLLIAVSYTYIYWIKLTMRVFRLFQPLPQVSYLKLHPVSLHQLPFHLSPQVDLEVGSNILTGFCNSELKKKSECHSRYKLLKITWASYTLCVPTYSVRTLFSVHSRWPYSISGIQQPVFNYGVPAAASQQLQVQFGQFYAKQGQTVHRSRINWQVMKGIEEIYKK